MLQRIFYLLEDLVELSRLDSFLKPSLKSCLAKQASLLLGGWRPRMHRVDCKVHVLPEAEAQGQSEQQGSVCQAGPARRTLAGRWIPAVSVRTPRNSGCTAPCSSFVLALGIVHNWRQMSEVHPEITSAVQLDLLERRSAALPWLAASMLSHSVCSMLSHSVCSPEHGSSKSLCLFWCSCEACC